MCNFLPTVEYLGHKISAQGLQPTDLRFKQSKMLLHQHANVSQLISFLGLVDYYREFLLNLFNTLAPLYTYVRRKLQKNTQSGCGDPKKRNSFRQLKSHEPLILCWFILTMEYLDFKS